MNPLRQATLSSLGAGSARGTVPFSEIDEAFCNATTPESPFSVELEVHAGARLDARRLRAATELAARAHPLATARQLPWSPLERQYRWEIRGGLDVDPLRVVTPSGDGELRRARDALASEVIPLDRAPPFRALLARREEGDVLMLNLSHAATDGIGGLRLLRSIARAYAGEPDPAPPVDPRYARSLEAELWPRGPADWLERLHAIHGAQREAMFEPPAGFAPEGSADRPGYGVHHARLSAEAAAKLRPRRFAPGTFNDLFLAALSLSIDWWNRTHGVASGRVALMVPLNLRPRAWWREVVGNFSMSATVSTRPGDRTSPEALLRCIVAQTRRIKADPAAAALAVVYSTASLMPILYKRVIPSFFGPLTGGRFTPTAVLSNLGRMDEPLDFGEGGQATGAWFSPPCRMPMGLGLGVLSHRGALHFSFRYRHPALSAAAAARFADMFLHCLELVG